MEWHGFEYLAIHSGMTLQLPGLRGYFMGTWEGGLRMLVVRELRGVGDETTYLGI